MNYGASDLADFFNIDHIPLRYPVADMVADLRVRVVCVSQAGRKLVDSQLRTGLRPGSSCLHMSNLSATCAEEVSNWSRAGRTPARTCGTWIALWNWCGWG